jgi:hypothetical protein
MVSAKQLANLKKEPGITRENAREMQKKSAAKRKENRTFRQIMEEKLAKSGRKDNIIEQVITKAETGDLAAFDRVRALLDEQDDEKKDMGNTFNLVVTDETAKILKEITG